MNLRNSKRPEITYYVEEGPRGTKRVYRSLASQPGYVLILSPHRQDIPKTYRYEDLNGLLNIISKKEADIILRDQFSSISEKWVYRGQHYSVSVCFDRDLYRKVPVHHGQYRVGWYRGRLYWFCLYVNSNNNSCIKYPLVSLDIEPNYGRGGSWGQLHNFKPVHCRETKKYL